MTLDVDQTLGRALAAHQAGRLADAEELYRQVLQVAPQHPDCLNLLGLIAHLRGHPDRALKLIGQAIDNSPRTADFHNNRGEVLRALGRNAEAAANYRQAITLTPDYLLALNNLGITLKADGRTTSAIACYRRLLVWQPDYADAFNNLGTALQLAGALDQADHAFRQAIAVRPTFAAALANRGKLLPQMDRPDEAANLLFQAVACDPANAETLNLLARLLRAQDRTQAAVRTCRALIVFHTELPTAYLLAAELCSAGSQLCRCYCRRAALLQSDRPELCIALARLFQNDREAGLADQMFCRAIVFGPAFAQAYEDRGILLRRLQRAEDAVGLHRRAAILDVQIGNLPYNLGRALIDLSRRSEAEPLMCRSLCSQPALAPALEALGFLHGMRGDVGATMPLLARRQAVAPDDPIAMRRMLGWAVYDDCLDSAALHSLHERFGLACSRSAPKEAPTVAATPRSPPAKLRVGYLSSDLWAHPVGISMLEAIACHDRNAFTIHFYAEVDRPDHVTDAFKATADGWCDIAGLSDTELAERIRADAIDILVCLAGHFDFNRPQIAAFRAAPVQISLHDVATSGLSEMDYIIGDRWLLPRHSREFFSERRLRLPRFYLGKEPIPKPILVDGCGAAAPVFGSFNIPRKISPTTVALWGRILRERPDGRLHLQYMDYYAASGVRETILRGLVAAGAVPDQVTFGTEREGFQTFLSRYNDIDVALDTVPFSGSTTSFQSLSMGVPVVTWPWDRMVSRWTEAILRVLDMQELVAGSAGDYVAIALRLAEERTAWRQRRAEISRLALTRLCDGARWTRHLERLFKTAWRCHQSGMPARR